MSKEGFSRRSFLRNTAVGTTGAALAAVPAAHDARGRRRHPIHRGR